MQCPFSYGRPDRVKVGINSFDYFFLGEMALCDYTPRGEWTWATGRQIFVCLYLAGIIANLLPNVEEHTFCGAKTFVACTSGNQKE